MKALRTISPLQTTIGQRATEKFSFKRDCFSPYTKTEVWAKGTPHWGQIGCWRLYVHGTRSEHLLSEDRPDPSSGSISRSILHRQRIDLLSSSTAMLLGVLWLDNFLDSKGICSPQRTAQPIILCLQSLYLASGLAASLSS